jgi:hypothetical protein
LRSIRIMKLRDQLRTDKGTFYNWPPIWTNTRQDPTDKPQGEKQCAQCISQGEKQKKLESCECK